MEMKFFIPLFVIGIIGVVFCELEPEQKRIVSCIRQITIEIRPNEDALLNKLSIEDFFKVLSKRFYYWDINNFVLTRFINDTPKDFGPLFKMYEKCGKNGETYNNLMRYGEELLKEKKGYESNRDDFVDDLEFTIFRRIILGLISLNGYIREYSELFEHQFAAAILGDKLENEINGSYDGIPYQLTGYDERTVLIERYCADFQSNSKNERGQRSIRNRLSQWFQGKLYYGHKGVYDKYVQRGKERLKKENLSYFQSISSAVTTTNYESFISEICNTSNWVNFESLDDEAKKYDRFECILINTHDFIKKVDDLFVSFMKPDFKSTFMKNGTLSIEDITREAIEGFLKIYDKRHFRTILDIRNATPEYLKSEIEEKRNKFIALYNNYIISLKWTCMTKDKNDVPFHNWVETLSIIYMPSESIIHYLNKFKEDIEAKLHEDDDYATFTTFENAKNAKVGQLYEKIGEAIKTDVEKTPLKINSK